MIASSWVVGSTGLLGSSLVLQIEQSGSATLQRHHVDWSDPRQSLIDLEAGMRAWFACPGAERFELYWAAGAAVVSSSADQTRQEETIFSLFLDMLQSEMVRRPREVTFFLASSAGGIYAGGNGAPFHESSSTSPITHYGEAKLAMEDRLRQIRYDNLRVLIGRISNLYGSGQRIAKAQGFVSQLCKAMVTRVPMSVYVPLDTMRDFLHSDDAARVIVAGMQLLTQEEARVPPVVVKNICSGTSTTLGHVIHEARLAFRRQPAIVVAPTWRAAGQVLDLRISSEVWKELDSIPRRSLLVGLAQTRSGIERQLMSKGTSLL